MWLNLSAGLIFGGRAGHVPRSPLEMEREKQRDQVTIDEFIAKAEKLAEDSTDLGLSESSAEPAAQEP